VQCYVCGGFVPVISDRFVSWTHGLRALFDRRADDVQ
jgi:hypothetical protein